MHMFFVNSNPEKTASSFKIYEPLLRQTQQLHTLSIKSQYGDGYPDVGHFTLARHDGDLTKLRDLRFDGLCFADHYAKTFRHIDPMVLTSIWLLQCFDVQPLLRSLARFSKNARPTLIYLEIELPDDTVERDVDVGGVSRDTIDLLLSFCGLESIVLSMATFPLVSKEGIVKHAATLQLLVADAHHTNVSRHCNVSDLVAILDACSRLKELAVHIDLPVPATWTKLCHNIFEPAAGQSVADVTCVALLKAIAAHPRLHALRILDPPFLDWDNSRDTVYFSQNPIEAVHVESAAAALQNLMNHILQILIDHGSKMRQLGWLPSRTSGASSGLDSKGHRWPEYVYFRGRLVNGQGREKIVATPIAGWEKELGGHSVFYCLLPI
jgi:hypothetical protein